MTKLLDETGLVDVYRRLQPDTTDDVPTPGGATAARPTRTTWAGGWTTTWPRRRWRQLARQESIYKKEKFSDHAPITVEYELTI